MSRAAKHSLSQRSRWPGPIHRREKLLFSTYRSFSTLLHCSRTQWRAEPLRRRWALSKFYPRQHFYLSQSLSLSSQHIYNTQHCNWQFAIIGMVSLFLRPFHLAHNTTIFTMYIITIENLLFTAGILSLSAPYTLHTPPYFCTSNFQFVWRDSQLSILVEE